MKITEVGDRLGVEVRYLRYWRLGMFASACLGLVVLFRPAESFALMRMMTAGLLILVIPVYLMVIGRMGIWASFHRAERALVVAERKGTSLHTSARVFDDVEKADLESRGEGDVEYRLVLFMIDGGMAPLSYWKSSPRVKNNYEAAAGRINGFLSAG